ncbi:D-2-hydroxyacid dehydrogenase [Lactococcus allomyrinae]|uniref:D-2-hydroxyacid dehydrogenase n=1 Tax=Lactococcus allomyrinae TaxID=2419773 RepID=A0A387BCP1_9LACT|nr:D-2-hydroxyacid dehydrogenase [Lactococcus allomyrinae]AYG01635.1 D-2-hydroxyacid dehydrogenase [Lactococcus allomyrinae]
MPIKTLILTNTWLTQSFKAKLENLFAHQTDYEVQFKSEADLTADDFAETEVLIAIPSPQLLPKFKKLKWLQLFSAGTNGYTEGAAFPAGVALTNASGTYGVTISEHLLTMALVLMRRFNVYASQQEQEIWQNAGDLQSIYGSTILVHGLGDIGGHFAQKVQALGAHVIAVKRTVYGDDQFADEVYPESELDKILPKVDLIATSVPGTKETYKLFDAAKFALMKPNAIFLNVGRGTNVDLEALCDALDNGKLGAAGLDVTDPEPLPKGHRAWHTPNLLITPHASGGYTIPESRHRFIEILRTNLQNYIEGKPLRNLVDMQTGYKKK